MQNYGILRREWFLPGLDIMPHLVHDPLGLVVYGEVVGEGLHPALKMCPKLFQVTVTPMPDVGDRSVRRIRTGEGDVAVNNHMCMITRRGECMEAA